MSRPSTSSQTTSPRSHAGSTAPRAADAVDPDVDLHVPGQRREWNRHRLVLPVIAFGGMLGASARYAAAEAWPTRTDAMPWTTLTVNAVGCLSIGVLMVLIIEVGGAHPLLRPFAGVGVLGGFTTFSTYAVDTSSLIQAGRPGLALGYWAGTLLLALLAVVAGVLAARAGARSAGRMRRRRRAGPTPNGHNTDGSVDTDGGRS